MIRRLAIGAGVVAVLAVVVFASLRGRDRGPTVGVYTEQATTRQIVRAVKASGEIDPRVKVNISAHVIGKIERLYVEEGDAVEAGQPFLELETEAFVAARDQARAQVSIARSGVRQAEVRLEDAGLRLRRMERLAGEGVVSPEQLEQAQLAEVSARLDVETSREAVIQAQAALDKAADDLGKATIYAPISGRVIALSAEEGEVVVSGTMNNPASVIGTIADLSEILAEVDVDETEVAYVEVGQTAELDVDAIRDRVYRGEVVEIGSSGFQRPDQRDVTFFKVKVLLAEPDAALRPGMSVRAEIETAVRPDAVVAPIQAVVDRPPLDEAGEPADEEEIAVVFVVGDDEIAEQRPVETGISDETHVEIVSGLAAGERIVTGPYRSLRDLDHGDRLKLREAGDDEEEDGEEA